MQKYHGILWKHCCIIVNNWSGDLKYYIFIIEIIFIILTHYIKYQRIAVVFMLSAKDIYFYDRVCCRLHGLIRVTCFQCCSCADPEGGRGSGPAEKSQNIGFLSNTGLDPLKITKLPSQHSMLGHH